MHNIVNGFLAPTLHYTSALPFSSKWIELNEWINIPWIRFVSRSRRCQSEAVCSTEPLFMQRQVEVLRTEGEPKPLQPSTSERETKANLAERGCAKIRWVVVCVSAKWVAPCATATSFDCDYHHLPMAFVSARIGLIKFWLKRIFNLFCFGFPCDQSRWPS